MINIYFWPSFITAYERKKIPDLHSCKTVLYSCSHNKIGAIEKNYKQKGRCFSCQFKGCSLKLQKVWADYIYQGPVVRKADSAIHRIVNFSNFLIMSSNGENPE